MTPAPTDVPDRVVQLAWTLRVQGAGRCHHVADVVVLGQASP
jgi:hypothetical protein